MLEPWPSLISCICLSCSWVGMLLYEWGYTCEGMVKYDIVNSFSVSFSLDSLIIYFCSLIANFALLQTDFPTCSLSRSCLELSKLQLQIQLQLQEPIWRPILYRSTPLLIVGTAPRSSNWATGLLGHFALSLSTPNQGRLIYEFRPSPRSCLLPVPYS